MLRRERAKNYSDKKAFASGNWLQMYLSFPSFMELLQHVLNPNTKQKSRISLKTEKRERFSLKNKTSRNLNKMKNKFSACFFLVFIFWGYFWLKRGFFFGEIYRCIFILQNFPFAHLLSNVCTLRETRIIAKTLHSTWYLYYYYYLFFIYVYLNNLKNRLTSRYNFNILGRPTRSIVYHI